MTRPWLVFLRDGARQALPASEVERVLTAPASVRLPGQDAVISRALHVGNALLPLHGGGSEPSMALALSHPTGRFAIAVEGVLGFGALSPEGCWGGEAVTCRSVGDFVPALVRRDAAETAASGHAASPRPEPLAEPRHSAARWLLVRTGGSAWTVAEAEVEAIHGPAPCIAVPFAPRGLAGVVVLRGVVVPVGAAPLHATAGTGEAGYAVLRGSVGLVAVTLDAGPVWTVRPGIAPRLHPDTIRNAAGLAPAAQVAPQPVPSRHWTRLLPLMVGGQRFAVPVEAVQRVLPAANTARLPSPKPSPDGQAIAVDGCVVPVWDVRRWLGLASPASASMVHVLLREQGALAVDAVQRIVAVATSQIQAIRDPDRRLCAIAHAPEGVWPVLDLAALGTGGTPP